MMRFALEPADRLPAQRTAEPADQQHLRQPDAAHVDETLARTVAQVSLGSSAGRHGDWSVQGAMSQGDIAAWMVSGSYVTHMPARHVYSTGMSYSLQRYDGTNPAALVAVTDGNRFAAVLYAFDAWTMHAHVVADLRRPLREVRLHRELAVQPARAPHDRADRDTAPQLSARPAPRSRRAPKSSCRRWSRATWLPPERTFAPITGTRLHAGADAPLRRDRRARPHADDAPRRARVPPGHRRSARDAVRPRQRRTPGRGPRHYYVGSVGDVSARGWTVSLRQVIAQRLHGSVDYTVTTAEWQATPRERHGLAAPARRVRAGTNGCRM